MKLKANDDNVTLFRLWTTAPVYIYIYQKMYSVIKELYASYVTKLLLFLFFLDKIKCNIEHCVTNVT